MSLKPTRPLPANEGAEKLVLGALLISNAALDDAVQLLRPDDFADVGHASIWAAMADLHKLRHPVDLMTVAEKMRSQGTMPRLVARYEEAYLVELQSKAWEFSTNGPVGALSVEQTIHHAKLIQDASRRRSMILLAAQIVDQAYAGSAEAGELTERFQAGLGQLADRGHAKVPRPFRELLHGTIKRIEQRFSRPVKSAVSGIPTGLRALDDITQGYQPSEVFVLGARPSMGKTSLVLMSIFHAAEKGFPVLAFSLEMSDDETALRALASQAGVNSARLKTGMMETVDWIKITKASSRIAPLPIHVDDDGSQSVETICAKARKWRRDPAVFAADTEMGLIVVDYVQLIPTGKGKGQLNREQLVTEVFRQLKALAKELKCPLLLVVSLSRKCEERQDKRPVPSDIRDSGNIESDADTICMIYRDEVYNPETEEKGVAELIIRKARNGATGTVRARWYAETTTFTDE
jgi:replicative DNA helicase